MSRMECRLLGDSTILWHILETSFAFGVILSLSPSFIALSFLSFGGLMPACKPELARATITSNLLVLLV